MSSGIPSRTGRRSWPALALSVLLCALPVSAQDGGEDGAMGELNWTVGPATADLGSIATVQVPKGFRFAGAADTRKLMEAMENPVSDTELGLLLNEEDNWFVVFEWDEVGYVKDDDKDNLDANALLKSIRKGTEESNKERRRRGWHTLEVVGWEQPPHYDAATQNLVWAIRGRSQDGDSVNYNTRRLGRKGVVSVTLVLDPEQLESTVPEFNSLMTGFGFTSGNRYGDFRAGDRIAEYGLTALVAGGVAAVALKSGLFKWLWKLIVVGVVAIAGLIKALFRRRSAA